MQTARFGGHHYMSVLGDEYVGGVGVCQEGYVQG